MLHNYRRTCLRALVVVGSTCFLQGLGGCEATGREFRAAAGPAVRQGVTAIVNGLLDGFFTVIEPDPASGAGG